jgi:transmembrane sensor
MADEHAGQPEIDAQWEALARLISGECTPDEAQRLRLELARDPARASLLAALERAVATQTEPPLPANQVESALAAVLARRDVRGDGRAVADPAVISLGERRAELLAAHSRWRTNGLRAAAAVLVVAGASMLWRATHGTTRSDRIASVTARPATTHYVTTVGRIDSLRLADGTSVVLGPSSELTLADGYGLHAREATLRGEAYFEVVHDKARPFVVHTSRATLRDVGTAFTVVTDTGGTRVTVTGGAVDVSPPRPGPGSRVVLRKGDRATLERNEMRVERGVASAADLSWTRGVLVFRDAPMERVASGLERWYGVRLIVVDSTLAHRRVTATFEGGTPDDVGNILAAVLGGNVIRSGDTLRLGAAGTR